MRAPIWMSDEAGEAGAACAASECAELAAEDLVGREDMTRRNCTATLRLDASINTLTTARPRKLEVSKLDGARSVHGRICSGRVLVKACSKPHASDTAACCSGCCLPRAHGCRVSHAAAASMQRGGGAINPQRLRISCVCVCFGCFWVRVLHTLGLCVRGGWFGFG